jgi:hypothetical protein
MPDLQCVDLQYKWKKPGDLEWTLTLKRILGEDKITLRLFGTRMTVDFGVKEVESCNSVVKRL